MPSLIGGGATSSSRVASPAPNVAKSNNKASNAQSSMPSMPQFLNDDLQLSESDDDDF